MIEEEKRVEKLDAKDCMVRINKLRKVYTTPCAKSVCAIEKSSFAVEKGECFALLGINGAGKTTTFKSLTQGVVPTEGSVTVMGHDVNKDFNKARQFIGYCPQHDTIFDALTVREHLEYICVVKRLPKEMRAQMCDRALKSLNLGVYHDKLAGTLSGGNKRKLSVAMALLGSPPVLLLDEPSAGMDPEARRFMWNIIAKVSQKKKQSGVVITTHSMEEAEALSTKMGILVKGGVFKCFGSSQHVKNKFGTGYEIEVKFAELSPSQVTSACKYLGLPSDEERTELDKFVAAIKEKGVDQYIIDEIQHQARSGGDMLADQHLYGSVLVS